MESVARCSHHCALLTQIMHDSLYINKTFYYVATFYAQLEIFRIPFKDRSGLRNICGPMRTLKEVKIPYPKSLNFSTAFSLLLYGTLLLFYKQQFFKGLKF